MASYENGLPAAFAESWRSRNVARWSGSFGSAVRRMNRSPAAFPGASPTAILGFASGATQREDTGWPRRSGEYANPVFREVGFLGTEAGWTFVGPNRQRCAQLAARPGFTLRGSGCVVGPSANPDPNLPYSNYARWAGHPYVTRPDLLGRPASLAQHAWYDVDEQTAVGLVNLRAHGGTVTDLLDARIRPSRPDTCYGVSCAFWGWSAGDGLAVQHIQRELNAIVGVSEAQRLNALAWAIARRALREGARWGARSHTNPAYSILRLLQKLYAGLALAVAAGEHTSWYTLGIDPLVLDILARAAYGVAIPSEFVLPPTLPSSTAPAGEPAAPSNVSILPAPRSAVLDPSLMDKSNRVESEPDALDLIKPTDKMLLDSYGARASKAFVVGLNRALDDES